MRRQTLPAWTDRSCEHSAAKGLCFARMRRAPRFGGLANFLENHFGKPVIDQTGLTPYFQQAIAMRRTAWASQSRGPETGSSRSAGPSARAHQYACGNTRDGKSAVVLPACLVSTRWKVYYELSSRCSVSQQSGWPVCRRDDLGLKKLER